MGSALALALVAPAAAQPNLRVDLFDARSNRTSYAIIDRKTGRVDLYDVNSNRLSYGRIDPKTGDLDLFNNQSQRQGRATITPTPGNPTMLRR